MANDPDNTFPIPNMPPANGAAAMPPNPGGAPTNDWANPPGNAPVVPPPVESALPTAPSPSVAPLTVAEPLGAAPAEPAAPLPGQVIADTEAHQMASADFATGAAPGLTTPSLTPAPAATAAEPVTPAPLPATAPAEPAPLAQPAAPMGNTLDLSAQPAPAPAPVPTPAAVAAPNEYGITPAQPVLADLPPAETSPALPGALPTDLNGGVMDPTLMAATPPPPPRHSIFKIILVIVGVVIGLLVVLSLVVFLLSRTSRKPAIELNDTSTQQPASSTPATIPANFVKIDKDCYSFAAYKVNTIPADTVCNFTGTEGGKYSLAVTPVTDSFSSLDALAQKNQAGLTGATTQAIQLDGVNTTKITYTAASGKPAVRYVVLTPGKNYQFNSKPVTGFVIDADYSDTNAQTNANTLATTWRWK